MVNLLIVWSLANYIGVITCGGVALWATNAQHNLTTHLSLKFLKKTKLLRVNIILGVVVLKIVKSVSK
ncbi:hypothetical protein I7I48_04687 [Histoplasma ohiense]|nr:hypothetical protein I7I48_04687 [Histoplasma ohiense (nom. inval.)]